MAQSPSAMPAPVSSSWQLDVTFSDPQRIEVTLPGESEPRTFWYLLYTVVNNTGRDVGFFPSVSIVTDTLTTVQAGDNVHPSVYDAIKARHEKEHPFFAPPAKVTGTLLQGSSNSRTTAAVFASLDPAADEFTVFASGFSGEIRRVPNPSYDPKRGNSEENPQSFILRRTLAIVYRLPGDQDSRKLAIPVRQRREWVMR